MTFLLAPTMSLEDGAGGFMDFSSPPLPYTGATMEGRQMFIDSGFINPRKTWEPPSFFMEETFDCLGKDLKRVCYFNN